MNVKQRITGAILAGGRGSRMGGLDKGLVLWQGKPLVEYGIAALKRQTHALLINANRHRERYAAYGYPIVEDVLSGYQGPLVGILSVLRAAATEYSLCVPCDAPLLPADLAERLWAALQQQKARLSVAHDGTRVQPLFVLLHADLAPALQAYLEQGGRKVESWMSAQDAAYADCADQADAFININSLRNHAEVSEDRDVLG